jgi:hypothetical protein
MYKISVGWVILIMGSLACSSPLGARTDGGSDGGGSDGSGASPDSDAATPYDAGRFPCQSATCAVTEVCWWAGGCCKAVPPDDAGNCENGLAATDAGCGFRCALPTPVYCSLPDAAPPACQDKAGQECHLCML